MAVDEAIEEQIREATEEETTSVPDTPATPQARPDLSAAIAERAFTYWAASGGVPGHDLDFWLSAENDLFGSGDGPTA